MTFGELLKKEIKKQRITQKYLANRIKISETALSQIITDKYFPSQSTIDSLCFVLKVKLIFSFEQL